MWELEDFTEIRRWYALHLLLYVTFIISSLLINAIQFILYITIRPFNKTLYRSINYYLLYSIMAQVLFLAEWWSGSDVRVYASDESFNSWGKEHAIIVMNHTYEVDWLMGWIVADRSKILGGAKVFVKNMMKYIPTIGWAWCCSDIIFLHRNWKHDKSIMESQVKEFFDYPYPVWMLLFCEGTRFTPSKHEASMEVARKKGLPELKHHLLPRTRGFIQCSESMRGHFKAIYDVTVSFNTKEGASPTLLNMLHGQKVLGELYVRRIPLDDVPEDDDGSANFLHNLYQSKDELLDSYLSSGSFTKENKHPNYKGRSMPRRYWSLCSMVGWTVFVVSLFLRYYYRLLTTGSFLVNVIAIVVILIAYFGLYKMIGLTRIDRASQYGSEEKKQKQK